MADTAAAICIGAFCFLYNGLAIEIAIDNFFKIIIEHPDGGMKISLYKGSAWLQEMIHYRRPFVEIRQPANGAIGSKYGIKSTIQVTGCAVKIAANEAGFPFKAQLLGKFICE